MALTCVARRPILTNALLRSSFARSLSTAAKWDKVVREAEDVVGGCSFRNVGALLSHEAIETEHTIPDVPRDLIESGDISLGLVALLFAKAAGRGSPGTKTPLCPVTGVLPSQYSVSKVAELLKVSFRLHGQVRTSLDMDKASKLRILGGDYVFGVFMRELALLPDFFILEHMASAYRDLVFSCYVGITDERNGPIPSRPLLPGTHPSYLDEYTCDPILFPNALGDARSEWTFRAVLGGGSLLAKSCLCCLRLADHPEYTQHIGFSFGKSLALAHQAHRDLGEFPGGGPFSLVGAPFLFQLRERPELYGEIENAARVDFDSLRGAVARGPGLEKTAALRDEYLKSAGDALDVMGESRARAALKSFIEFMAKST